MSVSGLDATQIQGVPVSATPPTQDQGLFYDATTGEWTPVSLTTAPGDLITGDGTGLPTLLRAGSLGQILEVGPGGILQWSSPAAGGVSQLVAGTGISLSPAGGTGVVTITNTGAAGIVGQQYLSGPVTLTSGVVTNVVTLTGLDPTKNYYVWARMLIINTSASFVDYWIEGNNAGIYCGMTAAVNNVSQFPVSIFFLTFSGDTTMSIGAYANGGNAAAGNASLSRGIGNATGLMAIAAD